MEKMYFRKIIMYNRVLIKLIQFLQTLNKLKLMICPNYNLLITFPNNLLMTQIIILQINKFNNPNNNKSKILKYPP